MESATSAVYGKRARRSTASAAPTGPRPGVVAISKNSAAVQLLLELFADQSEAVKLDRLFLKLRGQVRRSPSAARLVGSEPEIHQRGSLGSPSSSVATRLS